MSKKPLLYFIDLRKTVRNMGGFTLIELLIVIGLLGALASVMLSSLSVNRTESLDDSIVQKEMSDIQRAFQRFRADCVPSQDDLKLMTKYGLAVLMEYDGYLESGDTWSFAKWDNAKGKGWRGPYVEREDGRYFNIATDSDDIADSPGQPCYDSTGTSSTKEIPVVCTPYVNDTGCYEGSYYRVIPEVGSSEVTQLWMVFPSYNGSLPLNPEQPDSYDYKRRLIIND
jgi:prepilin-type N-terminal cleavage/methylation domain-containing protein